MKRLLLLGLLLLAPPVEGRKHHRHNPKPPVDPCLPVCVVGPDYTYCSDILIIGCPGQPA